MDRMEFIKKLSHYLAYEVRPSEVHRLIDYYDEMILDLMEDGYSEEEAVAKLGDPRTLADEAAGIPTEIKIPRRYSWLTIVLLILGFPLWGSLAATVFLLLLTADILIWCLPFISACFAGGFLVGGGLATVVSIFSLLQQPLYMGLTQFGIGMLFFGIGLLALWFTYKFSAVFLQIHRQLTRFVIRHVFQRKVVEI